MDRKANRRKFEPIIESFFRSLFFWAHTDKEFGSALLLFHSLIFWIIVITAVLAHVIQIPPIIIIFIMILCIFFILQHVFLGACMISSIEKRILGSPYPLIEPILIVFKIPISPESLRGVTNLMISILVLSFLLHLVRNCLM